MTDKICTRHKQYTLSPCSYSAHDQTQYILWNVILLISAWQTTSDVRKGCLYFAVEYLANALTAQVCDVTTVLEAGAARSHSQEPCFESMFDSSVQQLPYY